MDMVDLSRVFFAFFGVVILIFIVAYIAKKFHLHERFSGIQSTHQRLKVVDALAIDARRKLLIIRRDNKEHLVLLNQQQDLHLESYEVDQKDA